MLDRPDSPWYSSVKLYRQRRPGIWPPVFEESLADLKALATRGRSASVSATTTDAPLSEADCEKAKYERIWSVGEYRRISPGLDNLEKVGLIDRLRSDDVRTILDAGCGSGKLMQKLITDYGDEFEVHGFDISANCLDPFFAGLRDDILTVGCLWDKNDFTFAEPFDAVICTDVLEHIPTKRIPQVLQNLRRCARKVCYLAIALFPDGFGPKLLGEPLHLTVKEPEWWLEQFASTGLEMHAQGVERNRAGQDMWLHVFLRPSGAP